MMKITRRQLRNLIKEVCENCGYGMESDMIESDMDEMYIETDSGDSWTAEVEWSNGESEVVDVTAVSRGEAQKKVQNVLKRDYNPGGRVVSLVKDDPRHSY